MTSSLRVANLSKSYRLGPRQRGQYQTLREAVVTAASAPWLRLRHALQPGGKSGNSAAIDGPGSETLWALKHVSFAVRPGEVVGIIGRNGAGKSTLLKILSRITEPTEGRAELRGRIGSLLEVGTGFHAELTGRENIFLSGAILGMSRAEIGRKFDEIVAFSEIEEFLDTPVKRYSSGMYVRLAFAVAAHLEPEILVVDEVLAVGDVAFQKKCLQRMQEAAGDGRTVLFVSHNMAALQSLCQRGIVLKRGRVLADLAVSDAVMLYLRDLETASATDLSDRTDRGGAGRVRLTKIVISGVGDCGGGDQVTMGQPARFDFHVDAYLPGVTCLFNIFDVSGVGLVRFHSGLRSPQDEVREHREPLLTCAVDEMLLAPGRYRINATLLCGGEVEDRVEGAAFFEVSRGQVMGREAPASTGSWVFCMPHRWVTSE